MRLTAFFKLYKICILLHRCNLKIFAKNRFEKTAILVKFQQKKMQMSQNLQNFAGFQKFQLDNLVGFEKCCKTRICLQRSVPIQPKTSNFLPKSCARCSSRSGSGGLPLGTATRAVLIKHVRGGMLGLANLAKLANFVKSCKFLAGSFSAVSKRNFASKYTFESSRRDLHNALLCTVLNTFFKKLLEFCRNFRKFSEN